MTENTNIGAPPAKGQSGTDLRRIAALLAAILAAQLLYWFVLNPFLFAPPSERPALYEMTNARAAAISAPTLEAVNAATFAPVEIPWTGCCEPAYYAASFDFVLDRPPPSGFGFITPVDADNIIVILNGAVVRAEGRMDLAHVTYDGNVKTIMYAPATLGRTGVNTITIILVRAGQPYADVNAPPLISDYAEMRAKFGTRDFVLNEYGAISSTIGFVLALIAFVVMLRSDDKALPFWVMLLILAWALKTHFYNWTDPPFSSEVRLVYYFALTNLVSLAWLNFADAWTGRPIRWVSWTSVAAFAVVMGVTAWAIPLGGRPQGFDLASDIANYFGLALGAAAILRFLWHVVRHRDGRIYEVAIFALCLTLLALELLSEVLSDVATGNLGFSLPLLLMAFALVFVGRNMRLFRSLNAYNGELTAKLVAQEAQIRETHARERDLVRREALQFERQRIMRDMHDGIGSQLMSLLLAARRGATPSERIAEGVQAVIDELRLMIDSMDSVGESLPSALATFRDRTGPRVEAAGVAFQWSEIAVAFPRLGPREVLNCFRILQEAVNNALRHAGAKTISISITPGGDAAFPVRLVVADDGAGLAADAPAGRGLENMRTRAKALGARFAVETSDKGVRIVLDLPVRAGADDMQQRTGT